MAVNLIVEDGTGLVNANSYITVAEARQYAENRLVDLGESDEQIAANLILAADYMETQGPYIGVSVNGLQNLSFPRIPKYANYPIAEVPQKVKDAQAQLLLDIKESGALLTSSRQYAIKRKKLEGLEFEYAVGAYTQYSAKSAHTVYENLMSKFKSNAATGGYVYR